MAVGVQLRFSGLHLATTAQWRPCVRLRKFESEEVTGQAIEAAVIHAEAAGRPFVRTQI